MEHHHHQHGPVAEPDEAAMAELLDLDAEVLHSYLSEVTAWIDTLAAEPPHRILDLGSGTGTGALALVRRFPGADIIAVDKSAPLLDHLSGKARALGVACRIRIVPADLDTAWPAIGPVDVAWASSSLHHMADPDRILAEVFGAIRPGGLLAVAELGSFPRFLPDDIGIGRPGLEARGHAALAEAVASEVPQLGLRLGPPPDQGRLRHRGRADLHHRSGAAAARRHRPLRPGVLAAHPAQPRRPDERRRPGRARHPHRQRRTR